MLQAVGQTGAFQSVAAFFNTTTSEEELVADLEDVIDLDALDAEVELRARTFTIDSVVNWRRYGWLHNLVAWVRRVSRASQWARAIVWYTPQTLVEFCFPESSIAFQRHLLTHSEDVALLRGGVKAAELEVEVIRGAHRRVIEDLNFYDVASPSSDEQLESSSSQTASSSSLQRMRARAKSNPGRLCFPFRTRCWDFKHPNDRTRYKFCPFREVTLDEHRSLGTYQGWHRDPVTNLEDCRIMTFGGGDPTNCPQHKPRRPGAPALHGQLHHPRRGGADHLQLRGQVRVADRLRRRRHRAGGGEDTQRGLQGRPGRG